MRSFSVWIEEMELAGKSGTRWVLLAMLAVGILLGFAHFGPLWHDELQSVTFGRADLPHLVEAVGRFDFHPPLYYIFLHYWTEVSTQLMWLRFSSVFFWLAGAVFLYFGARQVFDGDSRAGVVAAVLFMLSPCVLRYAMEVRMYMPWMTLTAGSWFGFSAAFLGDRPWLGTAVGAACVIPASYSHGAGILSMGAVMVYVVCQFWFHRDDRERIAIVLWGGLLALLAVSPILWSGHDTPGHVGLPGLMSIVKDWSIAVVGFGYKPFWLRAVVLIVAIAGPLALTKKREVWAISLGFVVAPVLAALLISLLVKPVWYYRTIIFTSPMIGLCWSLVIAERIVSNSDSPRASRYRLAVPVIGLLLVAAGAQRATYEPQKNTFRAAKAFQEQAAPGAVIIPVQRKLVWTFGWYLVGSGEIDPLADRVREPFGDGHELVWSRGQNPTHSNLDRSRPRWFAVFVYTEGDLARFIGEFSSSTRFRISRFGPIALVRKRSFCAEREVTVSSGDESPKDGDVTAGGSSVPPRWVCRRPPGNYGTSVCKNRHFAAS